MGGGGGRVSWGIFWGGITFLLVDFWTPWCLSIEIVPSIFRKTFWPNCGCGFLNFLVFFKFIFKDFLGVLLLGLLFLLGVFWVFSRGFLGVHSFGFSGAIFLWVFFKIFAGSSVPPAATFLAVIKS